MFPRYTSKVCREDRCSDDVIVELLLFQTKSQVMTRLHYR
jgi:hypothetical protein